MTGIRPSWDAPELAVASDSPRTASYRALQSRWRETVLALPPGRHGSGPLVGSLLPEDAPADAQWLTRHIADYVEERLPQARADGEAVEENRLHRNLLSSQPLCFNVFGQFAAYPQSAARVLARVLTREISGITAVLVEHAPPGAKAQLGDRSAFDAFLEMDTPDARLLLGVETKYTEPFSTPRYDRDSYRVATESPRSWFHRGASETAQASVSNQLWRTLLLAQLSEASAGPTARAEVMVLTAANDTGAEAAVTALTPLLEDPIGRMHHVTLEDLASAAAEEPDFAGWSGLFASRYLNVGLMG